MAQFEYSYDYSSAAPELRPQQTPQRQPEPKKQPELKKVKLTYAQAKELTRQSHKRVARFSAAVAVVFTALAILCASYSSVMVSRKNYENSLHDLEIYSNSHRQLQAELAKLVSVDKIEGIAATKLGMLKASDENTIYINIADKNEIISVNPEK